MLLAIERDASTQQSPFNPKLAPDWHQPSSENKKVSRR
jgi:hypothetical protein